MALPPDLVRNENLLLKLANFVCFVLSIPKTKLRVTKAVERPPGYVLVKAILEVDDVSFPIDVTTTTQRPWSQSNFWPITIGSCLKIEQGDVCFRVLKHQTRFRLSEVVRLLGAGEDVKLVCANGLGNVVYARYYWGRIHELEKQSWRLYASDHSEPRVS